MFIGHFGIGFGSKALARGTSLGTLLAAALLIDLLFPVLALLGVESIRPAPGATAVMQIEFPNYPISHSLLTSTLWATLFAATYWLVRRAGRAALVVWAAAMSHWLLDALTHVPDLPLAPGGRMVGLGLWRSLEGTLVVEGALFLVGLALYLRATKARDAVGTWALIVLALFLAATYVAGILGPPPPSPLAFAVVGLSTWLLILWGAWIDRHRTARL
jgi:hypothetical protein